MRLALTGSSSRIAQAVVRESNRRGYKVIAAPPSSELNLLSGPQALEAWLTVAAPEAVIHLAGVTAGSLGRLFAVNAGGTYALVEAVRRSSPSVRIIVASSCAVYGQQPAGIPIAADTPCTPVSPYGASKAAQEHVAFLIANAGGIDLCAARIFNAVQSGVVPDLIRSVEQAAPGSAIELEAADCVLDFLHEDDIASALLDLASTRTRGPINVCSGVGTSVGQLARWVAQACDRDVVFHERVSDDPQVISWSVGDNEPLRTLGWQQRRRLAEAIASCCAALAPR